MPAKYPHLPPYRISYRYDCNFWEWTESLFDAIVLANDKHPKALITVEAGPMHVGLYAWQLADKTVAEAIAMFDAEVEGQIANLRRIGRWPPPVSW